MVLLLLQLELEFKLCFLSFDEKECLNQGRTIPENQIGLTRKVGGNNKN